MAMAPEQIGIGIRRYFTPARGRTPTTRSSGSAATPASRTSRTAPTPSSSPTSSSPSRGRRTPPTSSPRSTSAAPSAPPSASTSLRQVIDRVVDTITAWGIARRLLRRRRRKAAAFRNELKFVLLHQRAAFNSPVWFNIGVKGVPQQASACFILAVDDTMDGILNWYREEGIIFKGGSGSGINLSNIRSSQEHLDGRRHRERAGELHARRRRVGRHDQVGGKTRRAAKMVILNADHPDIEEFIWCKARRGAQGARAARRRLRHGPRRHRQPLDPVPERQQLGARHRRVHAGRRRRPRLDPERGHRR